MTLKALAYAAFAVVLQAIPATAQGVLPAEIAALGDADRKEFQRIEKAINHSTGDDEASEEIRASIEHFLEAHPNFVPMEVEAARLKWRRVSSGFGNLHGSQSLLPVFLEYQKLAPNYGKTYRLAALAYLMTNDFDGAKPSLTKAAELEPDEPRVDIIKAVSFERQSIQGEAIRSAQLALSKAKGDTDVIIDALALIADNGGIADADEGKNLVMRIAAQEKAGAVLTEVASGLLQRYNFQQGLIQVVEGILREATTRPNISRPEIELQWASMNMVGGRLYWWHGFWQIDPKFLSAAKTMLTGIQSVPETEERVWALMFDIALNEGNLPQADSLLASAKANGYSKQLVGVKEATLHYVRNEFREAAVIYEQLKLPKDGLYWEIQELTGNRDRVRDYRFRQTQDNPTDPYVLGEYASFMLYRYKNAEEAIDYGERAMALKPYPVLQQTLSTAYLLMSGASLRSGYLDEALAAYEKAKKIGFNENYLTQNCRDFCAEVQASLRAFR